MSVWTWLEYGAWAVSVILAAWMVVDTIRVKSAFEDPLLPSPRDGGDIDEHHGSGDGLR
jgi:hypothetical protein